MINENLKKLFKNPISIWLLWFIKTSVFSIRNRNKKIRIGYLSNLYNSKLGMYNTLYDNITISNSEIDDYVYVSQRTRINNTKIGKFCSIGPEVEIGLGKHPVNYVSTFPAFFSIKKQCQFTFCNENKYIESEPIEIGNDVWIGSRAIIVDGIKIGDGAIIGAGAVVTKNVEPYEVVGGVPAKTIKFRFSPEVIKNLLESKWWLRDIDWIKNNHEHFVDVEKFLKLK